MKRILSSLILLVVLQAPAQTLNSIGITAGITAANQKFFYYDHPEISNKNYVFGFNAAVFGEFFTRDYVRWVTEIQYNQKGSLDKQPEGNYGNQLQYLCWNNYLKIRTELNRIIPYILIGPRLEYTMGQSTASPAVTGPFLPLHISAAFGVGTEFVSFYNFKLFLEGFYVPDVMPAYISPELHILNKDFELRVGLKYEFAKRRERCNTPTYIEQ
jgi:hypothetical protein